MKKTIVIIGAGAGLGFSVAKKFAGESYKVILVARNRDSLDKMSDELKSIGVDVHYKVADSSEEEQYVKALEEIKSDYGTPDVIVYNVGITVPDPGDLTTEEIIHHFKTDVVGAYTTEKCFVDEDFSQKKGSLIFTGGGLAFYPADGFIPLSIDKAALRSLAYIFNNKLKERGIFVGTVTVCGTINGDEYFSADNIAEMFWQMNEKRDKCEYVYQYPELKPSTLFEGDNVEYGLFEENAGKYWGDVYRIMTSNNHK